MEKVFYSLRELDKRAEEKFNLKNGILMENAARGSAEKIKELFYFEPKSGTTNIKANNSKNSKKKTIQIICGSGDNAGDGMALARMLADNFNIIVACLKEAKSDLCKLQKERLDLLGIKTQKTISSRCDILVDAFLGTGLKGSLKDQDKKTIEKLNSLNCLKIAIDIPSGLNLEGVAVPVALQADLILSMGALKTAFFSDEAKDFIGKIEVIDLGLPRSIYENTKLKKLPNKTQETNFFFLEKQDMKLPVRKKQNTHKKSFGHCAIICGEKSGAGLLAASSALKFGAGLVTICGRQPKNMQYDFMYSPRILKKEFTSFSIGSGLGRNLKEDSDLKKIINEVFKNYSIPMILDADIFYYPEIKTVLPKLKKAVLTPHPKEFSELLKICNFGDYSVIEIQKNRFKFLAQFCKKYPNLVILLKGANSLIGKSENIYINSLGSSALSKAGTGDVLAGLICSLLAQGYSPIDAAITASLAHSTAGNSFKNSYSLTATKLIEKVENTL